MTVLHFSKEDYVYINNHSSENYPHGYFKIPYSIRQLYIYPAFTILHHIGFFTSSYGSWHVFHYGWLKPGFIASLATFVLLWGLFTYKGKAIVVQSENAKYSVDLICIYYVALLQATSTVTFIAYFGCFSSVSKNHIANLSFTIRVSCIG